MRVCWSTACTHSLRRSTEISLGNNVTLTEAHSCAVDLPSAVPAITIYTIIKTSTIPNTHCARAATCFQVGGCTLVRSYCLRCTRLAQAHSGFSAAAAASTPPPLKLQPSPHHVHMDNLYLHSGYSRPLRPNVYDRNARPSIRVSSDPDPSSRRTHLHRHKSSHRHHAHDEHRRHSSTRHHAREVVQSALQPPTSFGDLLKQARGSKDSSSSRSRSRSRRQSPTSERTDEQQTSGNTAGLTIPPPRPLRPEEVEREAKRVEARERCASPRSFTAANSNTTTENSAIHCSPSPTNRSRPPAASMILTTRSSKNSPHCARLSARCKSSQD